MKRFLLTVVLGLFVNQTLTWADTLEEQQEEFRKVLTMRFKYENLKSIRDNYEKELNVLEAQYERNKQIEDFQKKQRPDNIQTAVYTKPFAFTSATEWDQLLKGYSESLTVTKIPRKNSTDLIFHFPNISSATQSKFETYKIQTPTWKVISVLLSSGKLIPVDKTISPKLDEQSITVETNNASILKINLVMNYQLPSEKNAKTILTQNNPNGNDMMLLPSFDNVATLQLTQEKANSIIHIDAIDVRNNTLATKTPEKITNTNDLSTQAIRIDMLKGFIKALDDKEIKNQKDAIEYLVNNSESYLISSNSTIRQLSKSFTGKIEQVVVYTIDTPIEKHYEFSIY
ncbi:hypothetical protein [Wohlfahrtiimonas larvae]|uniref:Uncharacterized protein n=1 Tax=Wohlfahrtiimonas larvae TaxID=1157986 RepID=A0ABP9MPH6_9GAMM|nr:hypothetical protein [Wohlfahrtiimonas larvae]